MNGRIFYILGSGQPPLIDEQPELGKVLYT